MPTSADRVISRIEDHSNPEGTVHSHKEIPKPTTPNVATSHPVGKKPVVPMGADPLLHNRYIPKVHE